MPPQSSDLLGNAHRSLAAGDARTARRLVDRFLSAQPNHPKGLHLSGLIHGASGDHAAALAALRTAARLAPADSILLESLANAALRLGQHAEARQAFAAAHATGHASREARLNLAQLLRRAGKPQEAKALLTALIAEQADDRSLLQLGNLHVALGEVAEAIACYEGAAAAAPGSVQAAHNLAVQYVSIGHNARAAQWFDRALELDPGFVPAHEGHAALAEGLGDFASAAQRWRTILAASPANGRALAGLVALPGDHGAPDLLPRAERLARDEAAPARDRIVLGHALGKAADRAGRIDDAMQWFHLANGLSRAYGTLDADGLRAGTDALIAAFSADRMAGLSSGGRSERPIFIVGMPRSGTTLLEQALSRHPGIFAGGELEHMGRAVARLDQADTPAGDYPECVAGLDRATLDRMADAYLADLSLRGRMPHQRPVDKMPINFHHLGLIRLVFPKAVILHCTRDPVDTCLSCYFEHFAHHQAFATDLADAGRYYREYRRLMAHWQATLPDILDVPYEAMVADFEGMVRTVLDHAGLDWDDACLDHSAAARVVSTPSRWQVRQPIYTSSVQRWRRYAPHIGPLLDALGLSADLDGARG